MPERDAGAHRAERVERTGGTVEGIDTVFFIVGSGRAPVKDSLKSHLAIDTAGTGTGLVIHQAPDSSITVWPGARRSPPHDREQLRRGADPGRRRFDLDDLSANGERRAGDHGEARAGFDDDRQLDEGLWEWRAGVEGAESGDAVVRRDSWANTHRSRAVLG